MKGNVIAQAGVQELLDHYVIAELYTDRKEERFAKIDEENGRLMWDRFKTNALPLYVVLTPDGKEIDRRDGVVPEASFRELLQQGLQ